ncbi:Putative sensor kinase [Escherichia coli]|nr:Putative sensor kinase [Escherichia coli]
MPHKFLCYIVFSIFCIMGTWFGLHIDDSIANTRAIGAVMGGLLGGPVVGGLVGLTGGLHRYSMGVMTALSCMISTIVEGLLGGLVHSILIRRGRTDKVFNPITAGAVTFVAEMVQMLIILAIARPYEDAVRLVSNIAAPMMVTNTVGAALFMRILLDKRAMFEKYTSAFSATALKVAALPAAFAARFANGEQHESGTGAVSGAGYWCSRDYRSREIAGLYRNW